MVHIVRLDLIMAVRDGSCCIGMKLVAIQVMDIWDRPLVICIWVCVSHILNQIIRVPTGVVGMIDKAYYHDSVS